MILDLIVVGVLLLAFFVSAGKGLVKSVWKIAALIITIVLVTALKTPAVNFLAGTNVSDVIYDTISERLTADGLTNTDVAEENEKKQIIPKYILSEITKSEDIEEIYSIINRGTDVLSQKLTLWALRIIAVVGLFIIIRVLLMALFMIVDAVSKLPLIGQANALLGGLLGAVNILAVLYIACALVSLFAAEGKAAELINQSYIVKYIYNYNILLQLIF